MLTFIFVYSKLRIRFVDEMFTTIKGPLFLVKNFHNEDICYPVTEADLKPHYAPLTGLMRHLAEQSTAAIKDVDPEPKFPAIFITLGSAAGFIRVRLSLLVENDFLRLFSKSITMIL